MAAKRPQILVLTGEMSGKRFDIPDGGLRMGRSSSNDLHIPDEELSRNHCLFEPDGKDAIRIIDLASANGTFVNSVQLGASALVLKVGDIIEAGRTTMKVIENEIAETIVTRATPPPPNFASSWQDKPFSQPPPQQPVKPPTKPPVKPPAETPKTSSDAPKPPSGVVDLGLDSEARGADIVAEASPGWGGGDKRTSMRINILWGVVAILCASAIALMLLLPPPEGSSENPLVAGRTERGNKDVRTLKMLRYEKIDADARHIFRLEISINNNHELTAICDDVPGEGRHITKTKKLSDENMREIAGIFTNGWEYLKKTYSGQSSVDENRLESYRLFVILDNGAKEVIVENRDDPPKTFRRVRDQLEEFANNTLDLWAMTRPRSELMERIKECIRLGDIKMADRDVQYGNISAAIAFYSEAIAYARQFEPRPEGYGEWRRKLDEAETTLQQCYEEEKQLVTIASNQNDWKAAAKHLQIIMEMIPNEADRRYKEASDKLFKINSILSNKKKGKK